jgi:hypothetical protein
MENSKKLIHKTLSEFLLVSIFANPLNYDALNIIFKVISDKKYTNPNGNFSHGLTRIKRG